MADTRVQAAIVGAVGGVVFAAVFGWSVGLLVLGFAVGVFSWWGQTRIWRDTSE
jgi:hypothetical protein